MPAPTNSMSDSYDAVIAGGGHNGLVCAAYLARAGLRVKVLERRSTVGGAAVTEEFHPGFRNSVCSYTVSLLNPKVIADLDLHGHGLKIVERPAMNFLPLSDGRYLLTGDGRTATEISKFSARDAERYEDYCAHLERIANALRGLVLKPPPNVTRGLNLTTLRELASAGSLGRYLGRLGLDGQQDLVDLVTLSAADFLSRWFESEPVRALLGFDSIVGTYAS
ncbi:MAG: NAD(P)/FAD-dependent oxidoreductase, partial [Pseudomonadota bacterium]